jgi:hypothetical protein
MRRLVVCLDATRCHTMCYVPMSWALGITGYTVPWLRLR